MPATYDLPVDPRISRGRSAPQEPLSAKEKLKGVKARMKVIRGKVDEDLLKLERVDPRLARSLRSSR